MSARLVARIVALLALAPLAVLAQVPARTTSVPARASFARVTYVTSRSVYVDAGSEAGIIEGMRLEVVRSNAVIAVLRAAYLSPHRTSCDIASATSAVAVGDTVRFTPSRDAGTVASGDTARNASDTVPSSPFTPASLRALGFRGRVGLRQLVVAQRDSGSASLSQPAADVRLYASSIAGGPLGLALDVRGRHTVSGGLVGLGQTSTTNATVYQAALSVNGHGEGARLTVGRQYADALASVSLFDGVTASWEQTRWSAGALAGFQPEPLQLGVSSAVHELGAFGTVRAAPGTSTTWSFTAGAVGAYHGGDIDREYLVGQTVMRTKRASLYVVQEVDVYRGWKDVAGHNMLTPTSTFASLRVDVIDELSVFAGLDGRRNVLLFRDRGTPESSFDDAMRRGAWGGVDALVSPHVRLGADTRLSDDGVGSRSKANSVTGSLNVFGLTQLGVAGRMRSTIYSTSVSHGSMHVAALTLGSLGPVRLEANGGVRLESTPGALGDSTSSVKTNVHWFGADADVGIGGAWYLLVSGTRQRGGWEGSDQIYTSLTYRF